MHKKCAVLHAAMLLAAVTSSGAAFAQARDRQIYGWVDFGVTEGSSQDAQSLFHLSETASHRQPGIGIGAQWDSGFNIELGHIANLLRNRFDTSFIMFNPLLNEEVPIRQQYRTHTDSTMLMLGWTWPIKDSGWSITASGGVHRASSSAAFTGDLVEGEYRIRGSLHDFSYALRVEYAVAKRWRLGVGLQRLVFGAAELDRSSLRLSYLF